MITVQQNAASTVVVYPPAHLRGKVTSCTVRVQTPAVAMPDTGVAAALSSLDAVLTSTSAAGSTILLVDDEDGAVDGEKMLIGDDFVASPVDVSSGEIGLSTPAPQIFEASTVVVGLAIRVDLTSTQTGSSGNSVIECEDQNGVKWTEVFYIANHVVAYDLDSEELFRLSPVVSTYLPKDDLNGSKAIETAWETYVSRELRRRNMRPENIRTWSALSSWHAAAVVYHLVLNSRRSESRDDVDMWRDQMNIQKDYAMDDVRFWYEDSDEIGTQPEQPPKRSRLSARL